MRIPTTVSRKQSATTTAATANVPLSVTSHSETPDQPSASAIGTKPNVPTTNAPADGKASQKSSWHAHGTVKPTSGCSVRVSYR